MERGVLFDTYGLSIMKVYGFNKAKKKTSKTVKTYVPINIPLL